MKEKLDNKKEKGSKGGKEVGVDVPWWKRRGNTVGGE